MDAHGDGLARLVDVDAVVLFDGLEDLSVHADVVLDVQALVFPAFDHTLQLQLIVRLGPVHPQTLQTDEVMLIFR